MSGPLGAVRVVRGYRPRQLAARVAARARVRWPGPLPDAGPAPPFRPGALPRIGGLVGATPGDGPLLDAVRDGVVCLAGRTRPLDPGRLWAPAASPEDARAAFHVHYHDWLVPVARDPRLRAVAEDTLRGWLAAPPTRGDLRLAWHPYVVSSRVLPWAALAAVLDDEDLRDAMRASLWHQLHLLRRHPERDVAGNHLLRNGAALAVGGALYDGPRADALRRTGLRLLAQCVADQLGRDGMHVEGSTSYQALVVSDLAAAIAAGPGPAPAGLAAALARAAGWLAHVSPPGRPRPHLNDSADGQAPATEDLLAVCARLGVEPAAPPAARGEPRVAVLDDAITRVVVDAAPVCRPDLPYHAHADTLSITLDVQGEPVVVDRGAADYAGPRRAWWRSTAAHSTAEVGGRDSSEMVGAHRAGRVATTTVDHDAPDRLAARHDGGGVPALAHVREVARTGRGAWRVTDSTPGADRFVWRLHLAPGARVAPSGAAAVVTAGAARLTVSVPPGTPLRVEEVWHATGVGTAVKAPVIVAEASSPGFAASLVAG